MKPESHTYTVLVGDREITVETGKLALQAGGAVTVRLGDSIVFAATTMGNARPDADFFPLSVDYEERMYAGGRIPGSFFRREGKPSDVSILTSRLTDRPLRPLFPEGMRNEVQVILMSLSADTENPLDILCVNAASTALMISDIPWNGPVAAVRIGYIDGNFVINPTFQQIEASALDLRLAGTREAILMVECGANELSESLMVEALNLAHQSIQPLIDLQIKMQQEIGKPKKEVAVQVKNPELIKDVQARVQDRLVAILDLPYLKENLYGGMDALKEELIAEMMGEEEDEARKKEISAAFGEAERNIIRQRILQQGKRPDGRSLEEVRQIWCEVGTSPRAHGSGLFTRGETQVLTMATLGTPREAQELDNLTTDTSKRYMHHYNFPPYCTGEVSRLRGQSRREIGHGALAERALVPVLPSETEFPYTLRLVSEVLSSNGSSSMGSVCGSTLALMDTGVPIKAPVSGVAMGLIMEGEKYAILTDILGTEDHLGDMDFKVAGTEAGITALQMDIKIGGITPELMAQALEQARKGRLHILHTMLETISAPRESLKPHTPRIEVVHIPVDKIGALIGPGGKNIRALQEETNTKIDIGEDGSVFIAAVNGPGFEEAKERIERMFEQPEIGSIYTGKVVRTADFGAFVEILPGVDGLVHVSQLDTERVNRVEDIVNVGDEITVMIIDIDRDGKIRLSRQALLEGWTAEEAQEHDRANRANRGGGGNRSGGSDRGGDRRGNDRGGDRRSGGGDRGGSRRF